MKHADVIVSCDNCAVGTCYGTCHFKPPSMKSCIYAQGHTSIIWVHTISKLAILLHLTHGDYPNKLLNQFIPLVTHLLIPILIDLEVWTENLALKSKNAWLVSFVLPCHGYP